MATEMIVKAIDRMIKPRDWFQYHDLAVRGYQLIATKTEQKYAGLLEKPQPAEKTRLFGPNPIKPYRDYYGEFSLTTRLYPGPLPVKFAIGYTILTKVVTVDDYSNFGWLRLATGVPGILYPNLANQKQLLDFLAQHSKYPGFVISRVYHFLQDEIYRQVTQAIILREEVD